MLSFILGSLIPLAAILLSPRSITVPVTAAAVVVALAITGVGSAYFGGAPPIRAAARTIGGDVLAMATTYAIGSLMRTVVG